MEGPGRGGEGREKTEVAGVAVGCLPSSRRTELAVTFSLFSPCTHCPLPVPSPYAGDTVGLPLEHRHPQLGGPGRECGQDSVGAGGWRCEMDQDTQVPHDCASAAVSGRKGGRLKEKGQFSLPPWQGSARCPLLPTCFLVTTSVSQCSSLSLCPPQLPGCLSLHLLRCHPPLRQWRPGLHPHPGQAA